MIKAIRALFALKLARLALAVAHAAVMGPDRGDRLIIARVPLVYTGVLEGGFGRLERGNFPLSRGVPITVRLLHFLGKLADLALGPQPGKLAGPKG